MYALRRPDGSYLQKRDGRGIKKEIDHLCLYKSLQAMRASFGYGLNVKAITQYLGLTVERPEWPGSRTDEYVEGWNRYYEQVRIASAKLRKVPSEEFFKLLKQDGYTLVEVEIKVV